MPCTLSETAAESEALSAAQTKEASLMEVTMLVASVMVNPVSCFTWACKDLTMEDACVACTALSRCLQPSKKVSHVRT